MQFKSILASLVTAATVVLAADNAFTSPAFGQVVNVGNSITLKWNPTTSGKVNLILRKGGANDLVTIGPIASGIDNSGTFTWSPDSDLKTNTDYSVEIQDASNTDNVNFTPYFTVLAIGEGITSSGTETATGSASTRASSAASTESADASTSAESSGSASATSAASSAASSGASSAASSAASSGASSAAASSGASSAASSHASSHASSRGSASSTLATSAAASSGATSTAASTSAATSNAAAVAPANAILALGAAAAGAILL
ncbi:hypothetical protein DV451_000544 [Geotrichum candidum]|uniref:Yeast cell wall synthesis Kre9/Knh1-like N-terminal domain-containing protein n=1 Tax=Geotrichum candidum TaxID=1173061 RepID=A0A9P5KXH8_GEOCN|nr:hypothetical protein DV451_000544 [Geotrichum candidum]